LFPPSGEDGEMVPHRQAGVDFYLQSKLVGKSRSTPRLPSFSPTHFLPLFTT
jgi:hypothetical protein